MATGWKLCRDAEGLLQLTYVQKAGRLWTVTAFSPLEVRLLRMTARCEWK